MSFENLNFVLKQISSSNTYSSIYPIIQQYFFDKSLSLTSNEQEKVVRVCLRKLPEWFNQTPEQIKQIKLSFHEDIIRTPFLLKQKQLIDLLINELRNQTNDYLIFLLIDIYEKNYSQLLVELEKESDSSYIIHLPDRVSNISMRNIPACFQIRNYFHRLSEYIQEQLVKRHYPNMVSQIDTNVSFLCQLVHLAVKLGYTQYIWRPLYKNLFNKTCVNDSLWLRLVQYFLLETIDDTLLYTIQHGNADVLDLFLSDRILYLPSLETYLTDTLLFRKQVSIDIVRTILIYLTMSSNRIEKCFRKVFIKFLNLWSQESFIRFSSNEQHFYICQCICICLSFHNKIKFDNDKDQIVMSILNGIRVHIESTFDYIRRRGQFIGELIVERINLFSNSNQLQFDTYDKNHSEIQLLKTLADVSHANDDRNLSDDESLQDSIKTRVPTEFQPPKPTSSTNTIVLHDATADDDDDDDDSEFESYDCSHDTVKNETKKPTYIRECLADLLATDKPAELEAALHVLPSLVNIYKIECEEVALEIVRILLNYNSTFNIENFQNLQSNGLVTLCENYPLLISDYLCKQFYEKNYTLNQRSLILKTIQETGKRLSEIDHVQKRIEDELFALENDDENDEDKEEDMWRSIINKRLKLKTKYKTKGHSGKKMIFKPNHFGNVVGHFFYPLLASIDKSTPHLSLIDGDNDHLLLCELLACLGRLCIHAQNTLVLNNMVKQYLEALQILRQHKDAGVRHAVVYGYACCLVSLNRTCHDEDLQMNFIELKQWLDSVILKDTNTEVQKLGRTVRHILLKTLQEISEH